MDIHEQKYDEKETAKITGFAVRTLQRRRMEGKGPRWIKVGRLVRYPESSLQEFLDQAARNGGGE